MDLWNYTFSWCVSFLLWLANELDPWWPGGMDYEKINVILFCILLPALMVASAGLNVWLWIRVRKLLRHKPPTAPK